MQSQQQNQCQSLRKLKQEIEKRQNQFQSVRKLKQEIEKQQSQCQSVRKLKQEIEKLDIPFTQGIRLSAYTFWQYLPIVEEKLELMRKLKDKYAPGRMTVQSEKFIENNRNSIDNFMDSYAKTYTTDGWMKKNRPQLKEYYDELNELYNYVYKEEKKKL